MRTLVGYPEHPSWKEFEELNAEVLRLKITEAAFNELCEIRDELYEEIGKFFVSNYGTEPVQLLEQLRELQYPRLSSCLDWYLSERERKEKEAAIAEMREKLQAFDDETLELLGVKRL